MGMGLLLNKECVSFERLTAIKDEIKRRGVEQFIRIYTAKKDVVARFSCGDEIECMLVGLEGENYKLCNLSEDMIEYFRNCHRRMLAACRHAGTDCQDDDDVHGSADSGLPAGECRKELLYLLKYNPKRIKDMYGYNTLDVGITLIPEYASYMVETIPICPITQPGLFHSDMQQRINLVERILKQFVPCGVPLLMTTYPMLGIGNAFFAKKLSRYDFSTRSAVLTYDTTQSVIFPDNAVNSHPRFFSFTNNIARRRGRGIEGYVMAMADQCRDEKDITVVYDETYDGMHLNGKNDDVTGSENGKQANTDKRIDTDRQIDTDNQTNTDNYASTDNKSNANGHASASNMLDTVLIDSMGQGMGCCCLQITVQPGSMDDARYIHDQLAIISPLLLRLTRATPFMCGRLLNTETRWDIITCSVDCRTDQERGGEVCVSGLCKCGRCDVFVNNRFNHADGGCSGHGMHMRQSNDKVVIPKSRFSAIDLFLHRDGAAYCDLAVPLHEESLAVLRSSGVDDMLSRHISSLFIRDPMLAYEQEQGGEYDDFENIQSSNWRSVRFKIPLDDGWRVELRTMEIQPSVFENSAVVGFVMLLVQYMLKHRISLYIPMSCVDANFRRSNLFPHRAEEYRDSRANEMDSVFRKAYDTFKDGTSKVSDLIGIFEEYSLQVPADNVSFFYRTNISDNEPADIREGTLNDIFNGNGSYKGILTLLMEEYPQHKAFLSFIKMKTDGSLVSVSDYLRYFIINHKEYRNDGRISRSISNDLIRRMDEIRRMNHWLYLRRRKE